MKLRKAILRAKRIWLCGNGGSATNAIHLANDFVSIGLRAQALTADVATLTAIANDFSYEEIFSRQLQVQGEKGDLLICLSGSGKSPNILKAIEKGKELGIYTYAIVGDYQETEAEKLADSYMRMGRTMQEAEEKQLYAGHKIMSDIRDLK